MSSTTRKNAVSNIAARKPDLDIAKPANVTEIYGENAFTLKTMKEILPKAIYKKLRDTIKKGKRLDSEIADVVANAMKDWAISKGATGFSHLRAQQPKNMIRLSTRTAKAESYLIFQAKNSCKESPTLPAFQAAA